MPSSSSLSGTWAPNSSFVAKIQASLLCAKTRSHGLVKDSLQFIQFLVLAFHGTLSSREPDGYSVRYLGIWHTKAIIENDSFDGTEHHIFVVACLTLISSIPCLARFDSESFRWTKMTKVSCQMSVVSKRPNLRTRCTYSFLRTHDGLILKANSRTGRCLS